MKDRWSRRKREAGKAEVPRKKLEEPEKAEVFVESDDGDGGTTFYPADASCSQLIGNHTDAETTEVLQKLINVFVPGTNFFDLIAQHGGPSQIMRFLTCMSGSLCMNSG